MPAAHFLDEVIEPDHWQQVYDLRRNSGSGCGDEKIALKLFVRDEGCSRRLWNRLLLLFNLGSVTLVGWLLVLHARDWQTVVVVTVMMLLCRWSFARAFEHTCDASSLVDAAEDVRIVLSCSDDDDVDGLVALMSTINTLAEVSVVACNLSPDALEKVKLALRKIPHGNMVVL